jgi:HlyD family secretion protein
MCVMKKTWGVIGAIVIAGCLGLIGFGVFQQTASQAATGPVEMATVQSGTIRVTVDGSGSLAPIGEVSLAFSSGGQVAEVLAAVGDTVEAGGVLARLDDTDAREAVADAELQVAQAEINLALAQAEAKVGLSQANLNAAQAGYNEAVALDARVGDQLTSTRVNLQQARDTLLDAQADYDAAWDPARDWELNVKWKKDALEAEREATEAALERAQYDLEVAQANHNLAVAGISQASAQSAWAQVLSARVAVETEPLQLEQLQVSLNQAKLKLDSARRTLKDTMLVAPMAGTVTALDLDVGEMIGAGTIVAELGDLTTFIVDVNLDETDVAKISIGQDTVVVLDAFPDLELVGTVSDIAPVAAIQSGVVLYPVTIQLAPVTVDARAGMTADVEIIVDTWADVLIVPLRAIQSENGAYYVWRQSADGFEEVEVTLGVMTETEVEITGGLSLGDVVSVVASPKQGGGQPGFGPGGLFGGGNND